MPPRRAGAELQLQVILPSDNDGDRIGITDSRVTGAGVVYLDRALKHYSHISIGGRVSWMKSYEEYDGIPTYLMKVLVDCSPRLQCSQDSPAVL